MKKFFVTNIIIMVFANLLVKPIWVLAIDRNVQLAVGSDYGLYNALLNFSIIFSFILDIGLTNYNSRKIAANPQEINTLLPTILSAKIGLFLLYLIIMLLTALLLGNNKNALQLLILLGFTQFLNSLLQYLRSNISANHHFKTDSFISILDKVIMIAICGFVLLNANLKTHFTIFTFVYCQIFSYAISVIYALFICKKYLQKFRFNINYNDVFTTIKKSTPMAALILLMGVYMRIDSVLVERILPDGKFQNDLYARAGKLLDACNMIGFLFAGMLLPMFSKLIANKKSITGIVDISSTILLPISIIISIFSWYYKVEIMQLLFHNTQNNTPLAFSLIMICFPAYSIMNIYSTLLTANNNLKLLSFIALFCGIFNICANIILLPHYGYIIAAAIAVITHYLAAILYIIGSINRLQLPFNFEKIIKIVAITLLFIFLNLFIKQFQVSIWWALVANIIFYTPVIFILKLFDLKKLIQYLPNNNRL